MPEENIPSYMRSRAPKLKVTIHRSKTNQDQLRFLIQILISLYDERYLDDGYSAGSKKSKSRILNRMYEFAKELVKKDYSDYYENYLMTKDKKRVAARKRAAARRIKREKKKAALDAASVESGK